MKFSRRTPSLKRVVCSPALYPTPVDDAAGAINLGRRQGQERLLDSLTAWPRVPTLSASRSDASKPPTRRFSHRRGITLLLAGLLLPGWLALTTQSAWAAPANACSVMPVLFPGQRGLSQGATSVPRWSRVNRSTTIIGTA